MTNFFHNFPYALTGHTRAGLANFDLGSRQKVSLLGMLMLLPAVLWFISAYLICSELLGKSWHTSLLAGLFAGLVVFIVERAIVLSGKLSRWAMLFRVMLAFAFALLGSMTIDLLVLGDDIDYRLQHELLAEKSGQVASLKASWEDAGNKVYLDYKGKGVTRKPGFGDACEYLQGNQAAIGLQRDKAELELDSLQRVLADPNHPMHRAILQTSGNYTLLHRSEILHQLILEETSAMIWYFTLLVIGLMLELLPLVYKCTSGTTAFDRHMNAQEELLDLQRVRVLRHAREQAALNPLVEQERGNLRAVSEGMRLFGSRVPGL